VPRQLATPRCRSAPTLLGLSCLPGSCWHCRERAYWVCAHPLCRYPWVERLRACRGPALGLVRHCRRPSPVKAPRDPLTDSRSPPEFHQHRTAGSTPQWPDTGSTPLRTDLRLPRFLPLQRLSSHGEPPNPDEIPSRRFCCVLRVSHPLDALLPPWPSGLIPSRSRSWGLPSEAFIPQRCRTSFRTPLPSWS
jgi:hypothetical protein